MGNRKGDVLRHTGRGQAEWERCQGEWLNAAQMAVDVHECTPRLACLLVVADEANQVCAVHVKDGTGWV